MKALFYERAGLRLAVWETGVGAPMLFQHGLCGDASQPADVFPVDCGWRCLTMECRGHGRSDAGSPEEFSIATFAEDVASVIEAQKSGLLWCWAESPWEQLLRCDWRYCDPSWSVP